MKLCILIDGISNSGGTDRVASIISSLFVKYGIETSVYSLTPGKPYYSFDSRVEIKNPKYKSRIRNITEYCFSIKKNNFDHVIVLSMGRLSAQAVPLLKLLNIRAKIICNDHVSFKSFSRLIQIIKWPAYKMADKIVVLTESDRVYLSRKLGEKVKVVRNCSPYENAVYSSQDIGYKEKIVLAVGRLTYQKNFQRLISLWKKINSSGWKLVIIGSGEDRAELEELISKNGLKNVFIENPSHKLDEWYKKSSLLVMTSRYEGLPMVLIESKNFGLPAVAFNCQTGPVEIIKDDGFVIDYDDDPEFIRKVDALLENEILRHELSNNSLKNAENFTGNTILKEWLSVLI
jgi:amylovoran biosynthesis glycosyltransferase AmsD